jgi:hypothetical protein
MVIVAPPELSVVADEVYVPLESVTVPVGVPLDPATAIVTLRLWFETMLLLAGVTVTVAVPVPVTAAPQPFTTFATFNEPRPVALSNPTPAANPLSTPIVLPVVATVQFGVPAAQGIAFVPVSGSLK